MRLFAPDTVVAKSKFWYYLRKLNKVKRAHGEILACTEVLLNFTYYNINILVTSKKPIKSKIIRNS
jgi:hypothetical protein